MVDSPDSHFIMQKPAFFSGDEVEQNSLVEQRESNAGWCKDISSDSYSILFPLPESQSYPYSMQAVVAFSLYTRRRVYNKSRSGYYRGSGS